MSKNCTYSTKNCFQRIVSDEEGDIPEKRPKFSDISTAESTNDIFLGE